MAPETLSTSTELAFTMASGMASIALVPMPGHSFMIQDINTSIGKFDISDDDYLFMKKFIADAVYDDYDRLVQLCDALAMPTGFCLLEKRFVDVTIRYGIHPATIDRWKKTLEIKAL